MAEEGILKERIEISDKSSFKEYVLDHLNRGKHYALFVSDETGLFYGIKKVMALGMPACLNKLPTTRELKEFEIEKVGLEKKFYGLIIPSPQDGANAYFNISAKERKDSGYDPLKDKRSAEDTFQFYKISEEIIEETERQYLAELEQALE